MKTLKLNQMENYTGGVSCQGGLGATVGLTAGLIAATIVTGGGALFALGAMAAFGSGSILSVGNCRNNNWN
jgi:hypothetical protein